MSSCYVLHTTSNKFKAVENVINRKSNALDIKYGIHLWDRIFKLFSRFCIYTYPVNMIKLRSVCIATHVQEYVNIWSWWINILLTCPSSFHNNKYKHNLPLLITKFSMVKYDLSKEYVTWLHRALDNVFSTQCIDSLIIKSMHIFFNK